MSKILRNLGAADVVIADVGVTIAAFTDYTIPPQDYLTFAASSNTIGFLADSTLTLNDGSNDILNLSQAVDILKGWCPATPETPDAEIGTTTQLVGTVDDTPILLPDTPGDLIATCLIRCPAQTPNSNRLLYSFDGGLNYSTLSPGEFIGWSLRGSTTQITVVGNVPGVNYEVLLNRVPA